MTTDNLYIDSKNINTEDSVYTINLYRKEHGISLASISPKNEHYREWVNKKRMEDNNRYGVSSQRTYNPGESIDIKEDEEYRVNRITVVDKSTNKVYNMTGKIVDGKTYVDDKPIDEYFSDSSITFNGFKEGVGNTTVTVGEYQKESFDPLYSYLTYDKAKKAEYNENAPRPVKDNSGILNTILIKDKDGNTVTTFYGKIVDGVTYLSDGTPLREAYKYSENIKIEFKGADSSGNTTTEIVVPDIEKIENVKYMDEEGNYLDQSTTVYRFDKNTYILEDGTNYTNVYKDTYSSRVDIKDGEISFVMKDAGINYAEKLKENKGVFIDSSIGKDKLYDNKLIFVDKFGNVISTGTAGVYQDDDGNTYTITASGNKLREEFKNAEIDWLGFNEDGTSTTIIKFENTYSNRIELLDKNGMKIYELNGTVIHPEDNTKGVTIFPGEDTILPLREMFNLSNAEIIYTRTDDGNAVTQVKIINTIKNNITIKTESGVAYDSDWGTIIHPYNLNNGITILANGAILREYYKHAKITWLGLIGEEGFTDVVFENEYPNDIHIYNKSGLKLDFITGMVIHKHGNTNAGQTILTDGSILREKYKDAEIIWKGKVNGRGLTYVIINDQYPNDVTVKTKSGQVVEVINDCIVKHPRSMNEGITYIPNRGRLRTVFRGCEIIWHGKFNGRGKTTVIVDDYIPRPMPPIRPTLEQFQEKMPEFDMSLEKRTAFGYLMGINDLQIKRKEYNEVCGRVFHKVQMEPGNEIELYSDYSETDTSSIEFSIIDYDTEIPIFPSNAETVNNERIFMNKDTRFTIDETKPVEIKKDGAVVNITLEEAKRKDDGIYTITYNPVKESKKYLPTQNTILVKAILRSYDKLKAPAKIRRIRIKRYGDKKIWINQH